MGKYLVTYRDFGTPGETSTMTVPIADVTDSNYVTITGKIDAFMTELGPLVTGGLDMRQLVAYANDTATSPANAYAQREIKWLVKYHEEATGYPTHYMEIPCADLSKLDANNNDKIDRADADVIAFIAAFEDLVTVNGNTVVVDDIIFVSRRS